MVYHHFLVVWLWMIKHFYYKFVTKLEKYVCQFKSILMENKYYNTYNLLSLGPGQSEW